AAGLDRDGRQGDPAHVLPRRLSGPLRVRVRVPLSDRDGPRTLGLLCRAGPLGVPGGNPAGAPDRASSQDVRVTALVDPAPLSAMFLGFLLGLQHATDPDHLVADHEHGARVGVVHSHPHAHGAEHAHEHPHVHPSRWLATLGWRSGWPAGRALVVGAVHGLAGSAAVSLLVLATLRSTASAFVYLLIFGVGTILGMTL